MVEKLGLTTKQHPRPYYIQWFNSCGKLKVTRIVRIQFSLGSYHDYADCDVVPMQASSLLLGRPWQHDRDTLHHGRTNQYTLMFKGKKITLLPMSPEAILKDELERANRENQETSKNEKQVIIKELASNKKKEPNTKKNGIMLKSPVLLATKSEIIEITSNSVCYAIMFKEALFSYEDMPLSMPPAVANLLQEYGDVFPKEIPPGLPPIRGIEHQINLIPGASLPNRAPYRTNPEETKEIARQVQDLLDKGYIRESLSP